ncbi:EboA domain-containing protein [Agromyces sp. SYSU K20354]|uniref:EboA domain-containing protein n=1 Tax=Agromyces cavernae TaxID=2898659 RepID=UPI001E55BEE8|nr:EboA domain-containing protein [Agromyces cavernae]MCD2441333.1 EboA domain-containing protein [Agromyces cavernae]
MTHPWTANAVTDIAAEPQRIAVLFPAAGRAVGREPVDAAADPLGLRHGTADDLAREQLVGALLAALPPDGAAAALGELYRYGDDAERRGVLRGLNAAPEQPQAVVSTGLELVADALRTNDTRLVAAALGDFAGAHLDDHAWRHGVLKALFMGIPVDVVARLDDRADDELARMAAGLVAERRAAGREINDDMTRLAHSTTTTPTPGG